MPKIGIFTGTLLLRKLVHVLSLPYIYDRQEGGHRLDLITFVAALHSAVFIFLFRY